MGWERRAKREHTCEQPNALQAERKHADVGDIWKCRKCGARWELTYKGIYATNRAGPLHENTWRRRESEDYEAVFPPPGVEPPRQTGTDWLTTTLE